MTRSLVSLVMALSLLTADAAMAASGAGALRAPEPSYDETVDGTVELAQAYGNCMRAAEQARAMTGGEVLSVVPARNGRPVCRVTVLVINAQGRPKRIRLRIPMDF